MHSSYARVELLSLNDGPEGEIQMADITPVTTELLEAFADAWNRHDVDALMSFMTPDCVFESSAEPDKCGTRYEGEQAVRAGYVQAWTTFPDAHWGNARHFVCGNRGVSEWTFTGTRDDGTRVEVHGCDVFTFRSGKIALKDSYRKNRPPLASSQN
jgi:ketosteroid isomerase-like protein